METAEYKNIFKYETSHFLYTSRHNLVFTLTKQYLSNTNRSKVKILDAGCGTGLLAKKLEKFGRVLGVDTHPEAIRYSKRRGVTVKKASVTNLPFPNNMFDLVTSIDVIYHKAIRYDQEALEEFYRVLKPGGILILRVPAIKWFHLSHDKHVHTRERYAKNELVKKLYTAGFLIEKISYVNMFLFPLAAMKNIWESLFPPSNIQSGVNSLPKSVNTILTKLLNIEIFLFTKVNLPFGIGLITVARKPYATK